MCRKRRRKRYLHTQKSHSPGPVKVGMQRSCAAALLMGVLAAGCAGVSWTTDTNSVSLEKTVILPEPRTESGVSVEEALNARRSTRDYTGRQLSLADAGQILWAAQGVTDNRGYRTAPSAGGLYPLEVYIVAGSVAEIEPGVYHYRPDGHLLILVGTGDRRVALQAAAMNQAPVGDAPATIVIAAVPSRTTAKYGERGVRYVAMEAGHAAENIYLQAEALDLATVVIGAFDDDGVRELIGLPEEVEPLYLMPVGHPIPGKG